MAKFLCGEELATKVTIETDRDDVDVFLDDVQVASFMRDGALVLWRLSPEERKRLVEQGVLVHGDRVLVRNDEGENLVEGIEGEGE